jgi:hypothetical protein
MTAGIYVSLFIVLGNGKDLRNVRKSAIRIGIAAPSNFPSSCRSGVSAPRVA